ncbi:MAG: 2Fe-2S iron-sulfur cluster-binding protein [Dehalococcoidia bacterium]
MSLTIDGAAFEPAGTILDAVLALGIHLPHLCKDDNLPAIGACRTCLVEADGRVVAACSMPASAVSTVQTSTERVRRLRHGVLELTAAMQHRFDDADAPRGPLGHTTRETIAAGGADGSLHPVRTASHSDASNPFFSFHEDACILCARCTTACQSLQHIGAIGLAGRGHETRVTPGAGQSFLDSICTSCGSCVAACPTHALRPRQGGL